MGKQSKGHAIMISLPYQGHSNPFTSLALKLASKGFAITFVHLEFFHHKLSKARHNGEVEDFFSEARESGLDIRYATIGDGFPLEFDREHHAQEYWEVMLRDFPARVDEFVGKMINRCDPCAAFQYFLVTDTIYTWAATIADKYNIVNVSFWTQPALVFSLLYHWDLLTERGHSQCKDKTEDITYVPGVESINTKDLMSTLREAELGVVYKTLSQAFKEVKRADFILHNTVEDLEPDVLSALNKYQPNYAVGPINFSKSLDPNTVSKSLWYESDCTQWLESKSLGSVLYVSFGSCVHTSKQIIEEMAYGLLLSEVNFIWVVRDGILNSGDANVLPVGYEDEIKDKGLIVPWCNQITVLSNPAVGGFLTHCGWNSIVESMWFGVPMICYPVTYDQPTNRKLVVDDWNIGINLCDGESVNRFVVAEKIKSFMSECSISESSKMETDKVKEAMRKALDIDGSSRRNFDRFTKDLEAKIHTKDANLEIYANQQIML